MHVSNSSPACLSSFPSSSLHFFLSFILLIEGGSEDNFQESFSPSTIPGVELKLSFPEASVHQLSHLAGWGVAFLAFPTLEFQLQISHVSESSLKYHRFPPCDFQRHLLPLYRREMHSLNGAEATVCLLLSLPTLTLGTESGILPMLSKCSSN